MRRHHDSVTDAHLYRYDSHECPPVPPRLTLGDRRFPKVHHEASDLASPRNLTRDLISFDQPLNATIPPPTQLASPGPSTTPQPVRQRARDGPKSKLPKKRATSQETRASGQDGRRGHSRQGKVPGPENWGRARRGPMRGQNGSDTAAQRPTG
jgi:hypothetical protein